MRQHMRKHTVKEKRQTRKESKKIQTRRIQETQTKGEKEDVDKENRKIQTKGS